MTVGLCLMTYNEAEGCRVTLPLLDTSAFDEVFAVDGGSTDGTIGILQSAGIEVRVQPRKGYNAAYHHAFESSKSDALVFFHPKGTIDPASLLHFGEYFKSGHALVVASRMMKGSVNEEDGNIIRLRKWFVMGLGLVAGILWRREGTYIVDVLHGYRGMTRSAFYAIGPLPDGLSMDLEMVVRSYRLRLSRAEFPVQERPRIAGASHFKAFPTAPKLFRYLLFEMGRKA